MAETVQSEPALRQKLVECYNYLVDHRLTELASGNVSCRHGDAILISPTGARRDTLTPESVVHVDRAGNWSGAYRPSSELAMHTAIYNALEAVGAVVHTHSDYCVALACCQRDIPGFHYLMGGFGGSDVPCVPYATFGSQTLADLAVEALKTRSACLLANHGMICHGPDLETAVLRAHRLEIMARQYVLSLQVSAPRLLSEDEWRDYHEEAARLRYA